MYKNKTIKREITMKDYVVKNSVVPFFFGLSVFLTACSGTSDMAAPELGAAQQGAPAGSQTTGGLPEPVAAPLEMSEESTEPTEGENLIVVDQQLIDNASTVSCSASNSDAFRETMLAVIRAARASSRMCGDSNHDVAGTVTWNPLLEQAALMHVQDMATVNFFSHEGSDGLSVSNRADNVGYNWRAIGENIAAGQLEIEEVHQGWLDSPGHCRNIMNPLFTEVGAACVPGVETDYGTYWAVVFGDEL